MKKHSKEKIIGVAGTLLVHIIIAALLYFMVLTPSVKLPEKGVEVMMGLDIEDYAKAQFNEAPSAVEEPVPVQTVTPVPEEPLMTQDSEESLALPPEKPKEETPKKPEKTPEQIQREKEEAERKERERKEAEARKAAENSIANAFNKGSMMNKKGDSPEKKEVVKGSAEGNSNAGQPTGVGVSFSLEGRNPCADGIVKPKEKLQAEGRVVVDITVNPDGRVIVANINAQKSNTVDNTLREAALKAAKATIFNSIAGVDNQSGTITYNFELR